MTDSTGHEIPSNIQNSTRFSLVSEGVTIFFRPVTIRSDSLHRWSTLRATGTRALHFGFGHARARLRLQARANVDNFLLLCGTTARRKTCQQHQGKNRAHKSETVSHLDIPTETSLPQQNAF